MANKRRENTGMATLVARTEADGTVVDRMSDAAGEFEMRWMCEAPPIDSWFEVLEDEWNDDCSVRTIKEINIRSGP